MTARSLRMSQITGSPLAMTQLSPGPYSTVSPLVSPLVLSLLTTAVLVLVGAWESLAIRRRGHQLRG